MCDNIKLRPERVMRPNKIQDGVVYIRVLQKDASLIYDDSYQESRTISSVRVEKAVEFTDYLKICAEEGLHVAVHPSGTVTVFSTDDEGRFAEGTSIRQAYFRYRKG